MRQHESSGRHSVYFIEIDAYLSYSKMLPVFNLLSFLIYFPVKLVNKKLALSIKMALVGDAASLKSSHLSSDRHSRFFGYSVFRRRRRDKNWERCVCELATCATCSGTNLIDLLLTEFQISNVGVYVPT